MLEDIGEMHLAHVIVQGALEAATDGAQIPVRKWHLAVARVHSAQEDVLKHLLWKVQQPQRRGIRRLRGGIGGAFG